MNRIINDIIYKYYDNLSQLLDNNELNKLLAATQFVKLTEYINNILPIEDARITIIILYIIVEKPLKIDTIKEYSFLIIHQLAEFYESNKKILLSLQKLLPICLTPFAYEMTDIYLIRECFGTSFLFEIMIVLFEYEDSDHIEARDILYNYVNSINLTAGEMKQYGEYIQ